MSNRSLSFPFIISVVSVLCVLVAAVTADDVGYKVSGVTKWNLIASNNNSSFYQGVLEDPKAYQWPVYLVDLHGSRFQQGFDYAVLLGDRIEDVYTSFLQSLIGASLGDQVLIYLLEQALDWQWDQFLSIQLPKEYIEEISGLEAGGHSIGIGSLDRKITRVIALANAPGDPQDFALVLLAEWEQAHLRSAWTYGQREALKEFQARLSTRVEKVEGLQCSMFGVWGSRTVNGSLFSARNLDWNKDMGIQKQKLVTVWHPEGKYAHASLGYVGVWGALTGMSSKGITVHEANLEENEVTWNGFPWLLRLRYIMENAVTIQDGQTLWENTNNTVGFNHMFGSAHDAKAMVEETMLDYTAYFLDNDPREQHATYTDPASGKTTQIGFPLKEAVFRTNHGYDPKIREHFEWSQNPDSWSMDRYMMISNGFTYYESQGVKVSDLQAINITAIAGDKGRKNAYHCSGTTDGSNVLSATYNPSQARLYAAWEDGTGATWRPAACNTYLRMDMEQWWQHQ